MIRSHSHNGVIQQYVRESRMVRREPASNNICTDDGIHKEVENLPRLREKRSAIIDRYLSCSRTSWKRSWIAGHCANSPSPPIVASRQRIAGLKFDHPRQLALRQALVCFGYLATGGIFTTADLHPSVAQARGKTTAAYKLGSLRYDLSKLRAKGLTDQLPHSRLRLLPHGYQVCLVYSMKLFERIHAPLIAGMLQPGRGDG